MAGAGADGPVSADPPETVRPLDPAKKVAATQEKVAAIRKKVVALKISCGGLFTHFDRHIRLSSCLLFFFQQKNAVLKATGEPQESHGPKSHITFLPHVAPRGSTQTVYYPNSPHALS